MSKMEEVREKLKQIPQMLKTVPGKLQELAEKLAENLRTLPQKAKVLVEKAKTLPAALKTVPDKLKALPEKAKTIPAGVAALRQDSKPLMDKLRVAGAWAWRMRKVLLAIPIVYWSIWLGRLNYSLLPDLVGLNLQTTGEYAMYINKNAATYGPLAVTMGCLLMMFLSRKTLYPWLVCLVTLAIPLAILLTNIFPG